MLLLSLLALLETRHHASSSHRPRTPETLPACNMVEKLSQDELDKLSPEEQKKYEQARADQEASEQAGMST